MLNFQSTYGLTGEIRATAISSTATRLTFSARTGKVSEEILEYLHCEYQQYLKGYPDFMPGGNEPLGLFEDNLVSVDVDAGDSSHWAHFLRYSLKYTQYHFYETFLTKSRMVCDVTKLPLENTTMIQIMVCSGGEIPQATQKILMNEYRFYAGSIPGFLDGRKSLMPVVDSACMIFEINKKDDLFYVSKIKKILGVEM